MLRIAACAVAFLACSATVRASEPVHSAELDDMIVAQARRHGVPEKLVRRIVMRESKYNPSAHHRFYWGLMQISYPTAKSMGFKGSPKDLLNPLVNLTYAVPYLANAFIIAGKQEDAAVRLYASGYYQTAKDRNLLGALRTADSDPVQPGAGKPNESFIAAASKPVTTFLSAVANAPNAAQIAAAAPPVDASAQPQPAPTGGGDSDLDPEVLMVPGKGGLEPPKKWIKDGGVSVIARGEQPVDSVASYVGQQTAPPKKPVTRLARAKIKKNLEFASLDLTQPGQGQTLSDATPRPAAAQPQAAAQVAVSDQQGQPSVQAYSAPVDPRDAAPQTAIAKATSAQAGGVQLASAQAEPNDARQPDPAAPPLRGEADDPKPAVIQGHKAAVKKPGSKTIEAKAAKPAKEAKTARDTKSIKTASASSSVGEENWTIAVPATKKTTAKPKPAHATTKKPSHSRDLALAAKADDPAPAK